MSERKRTVRGRVYSDWQAYCGRVGKRRFYFFGATEEIVLKKAGRFIDEFRTAGGPVTGMLSARQSFDALNALELSALRNVDLSLSEIVSDYVRIRRETPRCPEINIGDLLGRFYAEIDPRRDRNRKCYRVTIGQLTRRIDPGRLASSVTADEICGFLERYKNSVTFNSNLCRIKTMFSWAVRERLLDVSPASGIRSRLVVFKEPGFFPPEKVEEIFRILEAAPPPHGVGMCLTLGFFAGIRSAEIARAKWGDLNPEEGFVRIPVPKGLTNGGKPRIVELEANAVAWVRYFMPDKFNPEAPVADRTAAVKNWKRDFLKPLGLSWGNDEYHNVMRHTYATMHVAAFRNAAATALTLGHGSSTEMLESHYKGLALRSDAEKFWAIMPNGSRNPRSLSSR